MKKSSLIISVLSTLIAAPIALADPTIVEIEFTCPVTSGSGYHTLINAGSRIAGYGTETINGNPAFNNPYFTYSNIPDSVNIPSSLETYSNDGTSFDSTNAMVSCRYASSSSTYDPFSVVYQLTNGNGGQVASQTVNTIKINQFIGYR